MSLIVVRRNLDSHQLDPGVHADGDLVHRFHIVPPMSGDIKDLSRKDREINKENKSEVGPTAHTTGAVPDSVR